MQNLSVIASVSPTQEQAQILLGRFGFSVQYFQKYVNPVKKMHSPGMVLMSFILRGNGIHYLGEEAYHESGGSIGVTHYGQEHDIITDEKGMDIMNIYLDVARHPLPELPAALREVLPELIPLHPNFSNSLNRMVRLQFDHPENAEKLVMLIHDEQMRAETGYAEAMRQLFATFLMECFRQALKSGLTPSSTRDLNAAAPLERVRLQLDKKYAETQTLDELARISGMSRSHLCRSFKQYTGKSPFDYLLDRRVQAAMLKLRSGSGKILPMSQDCGFGDVTFFNKTFKERVGETPTQYRRRWQIS